MKKTLLSLSLLGLLSSQAVFADSVWKDLQSSALNKQLSKSLSQDLSQDQQPVLPKQLTSFRKLSLDESQLKHNLQQINPQALGKSSSSSANSNAATMEIPLPSGEIIRVSLEPTQLLSAKLAAKYPDIKTWKVRGVDNKSIHGVIDINSYGFHAMLLMPDGDTVFVERENRNAEGVYNSFSKQANSASFKQDLQCDVHGEGHSEEHANKQLQRTASREAAPKLITYRLIVAATGEYTQYHGGTYDKVFSAISTTINRVNAINERDLSITFDLVDDFIFRNPNTDPYTNSDSRKLLLENIENMAEEFSASEFDIGHVFSQGQPSGLALLGSVCHDRNNTYNSGGQFISFAKAGGVTGSPNPNGDAFDVDFVAHELGHQLGAKHTFNSETGSCGGGNRTGGSAVEPGSGSTIMAYAGICGSNDLQKHASGSSDDYYHTKSILEIFDHTRNDNVGKSCGSRASTSNNNPEPVAKQNTVIPARTPFILKSSATDPDGDTLTYVWDQMDTGKASNVGVDKGDNALIRSLPPSSSSTRYVPRLKDIFQNKFIKGEQLPTTNRDLNFAFIVRDGEGGIGIAAESLNNNQIEYLKIKVADKGQSFRLASHGSQRNLGVNQTTKVSWNVAGTNASPINCSKVDISLVESNGKRVSVKSNTSNDGSETVTIPSSAQGMSNARMMVACRRPASTFFNLAKGDLNIVAQNQGEADSSGNNGAGSSNNSGGGSGSLNVLHLLFLLLLLVVSWKSRDKKMQKIKTFKLMSGV